MEMICVSWYLWQWSIRYSETTSYSKYETFQYLSFTKSTDIKNAPPPSHSILKPKFTLLHPNSTRTHFGRTSKFHFAMLPSDMFSLWQQADKLQPVMKRHTPGLYQIIHDLIRLNGGEKGFLRHHRAPNTEHHFVALWWWTWVEQTLK